MRSYVFAFTLQVALSLGVSFTVLAQDGKPRDGRSPEQLMDGEKVLSTKEAPLLNPIFHQAHQAWFELQNVRPGKNLRDALEVDYAYDGAITGSIHLVVNTNGNRLRFPIDAGALTKHQGVLKCSYDSITDKSPLGADLELYVELSEAEPTPVVQSTSKWKSNALKKEPVEPLFFKISKSATRGDIGALTYGRHMREGEKRIYDQRMKKFGPPSKPPAGNSLLADDLMLVPGTPVIAAFEGEWKKAEVLAQFPRQGWVVHWPELGHKSNAVLPATHIALTEKTIAALRSPDGAAKFKPSVVLSKGCLQPPPDGFIVISPDIELVPGTPVKRFMAGNYWDYTVIENGKTSVPVVGNSMGLGSEIIDRDQLIIEKNLIKRLSDRKLQAEYAENLKTTIAANTRSGGGSFNARRYQFSAPLPEGHRKATDATQLKVGDRGFAYWANEWVKVTVTAVPDTGNVEILWDGWGSRDLVTRDSLVVPNSIEERGTSTSKEKSTDLSSDKDASAVAKNKSKNADSKSLGRSPAFPAKNYPASQPIPEGYRKATDATKLKVGDRGFVFWGKDWQKVTVRSVPDSGDIEIYWDDWRSNEWITRDSLVVSKKIPEKKGGPEKKSGAGKEKSADSSSEKNADSKNEKPESQTGKDESDSTVRFVARLEDAGSRKPQVASWIRSSLKISQEQANELVKNAPIEISDDLNERDAHRLKKTLELLGAKVSIDEIKK